MASCLYAALLLCLVPQGILAEYYGKFIGNIKTNAHDFKGKVYAVSENQVYIAEMSYDGQGPAAYFWAGKGAEPDNQGSAVPDEDNSSKVLQRYDNSLVLLRLPKKITEYDYLGIYCKKFAANFGHVLFRNVQLPMEQRLEPMATKKNGVKANEVILKDSATIELRDFEYDGQGGDVYFAVGANRDDSKDRLTKLADENGRNSRLGAYQPARTITLRLPEGHHWNEYKWFTVYNFDGSGESYGDVYVDTSVAEKLPVHAPMSKVSKRNVQGGGDSGMGGSAGMSPVTVMSLLGLTCLVAFVSRWHC